MTTKRALHHDPLSMIHSTTSCGWRSALARAAGFVVLLVVVDFAACGKQTPSTKANPRQVVVYSSADKEFAELIFAAYEKKSGVQVLPVYDTEETKTAGLTSRLAAEREHPLADVFWSSDTSRAIALADQGLAAPYDSPSAAGIPAPYRDASHLWTGFGARIRVILYNTSSITPDHAPKSIRDFLEPGWNGRYAFPNPHFGTMSYHAAALFALWGDAKATDFFEKLKRNGAVVAAGNADVRDRVADGRVDAGVVDEDDAVAAVRDGKPVAIMIPDQEGSEAIGTPVMPNTAMLVAGAPHSEEGKRFLDFLLSPEAESILAASDAAQFPLHPGLPGPTSLPPLEKIRALRVDPRAVAKKLPAMDSALQPVLGL